MSAAQLNFSMLLHNFCRVRLQNWIGVVADITVNARHTVRRTVLVYQGAITREARYTVRRTVLVYHGASTRERSSETGEGHSGPYAGEIRDGYALRTAIGWHGCRSRCLPPRWHCCCCEQCGRRQCRSHLQNGFSTLEMIAGTSRWRLANKIYIDFPCAGTGSPLVYLMLRTARPPAHECHQSRCC